MCNTHLLGSHHSVSPSQVELFKQLQWNVHVVLCFAGVPGWEDFSHVQRQRTFQLFYESALAHKTLNLA